MCAETATNTVYVVRVAPGDTSITPLAGYANGGFFDRETIGASGTTAFAYGAGTEFSVLRRGRVVGHATVVRADTAAVALTLDPGYDNVGVFLAVSPVFATPSQNFRPELSPERIKAYHNNIAAAAAISFKANRVPEALAGTSQPRTLNIFQHAPGAPTVIACSMIIPNDTNECAGVYNRMDCAAHSLFAVIKHKDMSLKPLMLKYVFSDDFASAGLEEVIDVYDIDRDGDADLFTEVCTWWKCRFKIYLYDNENYTPAFEGSERDWKNVK